MQPPEVTFFEDSPHLTIHAMHERIKEWQQNRILRSGSTAIGHIALTAEHRAIVDSMAFSGPYSNIFDSSIPDVSDKGKLDESQQTLCRLLCNSFSGLVLADMRRSGLGESMHVDVRAGKYSYDGEGWHVDGGRRYLGKPIGRWVVAWGVGSTRFASGPINKDMIADDGSLNLTMDDSASPLKPQTYELGTVARFMAQVDVHSSPNTAGSRIFMSATALL